MKKITTFLMAILFASVTFAQDLSLDEVLNNYYDVMGMNKYKDVNNIIVKGKSMNMGMENPFTMYQVRPNSYRLEVPIQGQTMIQVYSNGAGWVVAPWSGTLEPQDIPEEQLKAMKRQADIEGSLYNYKEKGYTAELLGKEDMEGSEVYKVKLTYEDGDNETYFIDAENFVVLKQESTVNMRGQEIKSETYFSDFKPVGDDEVIMPWSFQVKMGGQVAQSVVIEDVQFNQQIDDKLFNKPEKTESPDANNN